MGAPREGEMLIGIVEIESVGFEDVVGYPEDLSNMIVVDSREAYVVG